MTPPPPPLHCEYPDTLTWAAGVWENFAGVDLVSPTISSTVSLEEIGSVAVGQFNNNFGTTVSVSMDVTIHAMLDINITCQPGQNPTGEVYAQVAANLYDVSTSSWVSSSYLLPPFPYNYLYSYSMGCGNWYTYLSASYSVPGISFSASLGHIYNIWVNMYFDAEASAAHADDTVHACNDFQEAGVGSGYCAYDAHPHRTMAQVNSVTIS